MSAGPVRLVARREFITRMVTKSNLISLAVMLALIAAGAVILGIVLERDGGPPSVRLGVDASVASLEAHLDAAAQQQGVELEVVPVPAADAAAALTADADPLDAHLAGEALAPEITFAERPDAVVVGLVGTAVQSAVISAEIGALGGDPAEFTEQLLGAAPSVTTLEEPTGGDEGPEFALAMVMISLLLFALISTGSVIAMGVVEEKTSRVVEVLLATIRPAQLLTGKILGIGAFGMVQVLVLGGALGGAFAWLGVTEELRVHLGWALVQLVIWFVLGYLVFALLFGGFAALVSRQEEIGSVTTPLMILVLAPFYVALFAVPSDPDGTLVRVLSQVPLLAPFMMPVRTAFGAVTAWEIALAFAITAATIPLLVWVAARVYRRGVLHTGGRMKLSVALRG